VVVVGDFQHAAVHFARDYQLRGCGAGDADAAVARDRCRGAARLRIDGDGFVRSVRDGGARGQHEHREREQSLHKCTCFTSSTAGISRSAASGSSPSAESTVIMAMALPPVDVRARLYSAILMLKSPSVVPTRPTTPGTSLLTM